MCQEPVSAMKTTSLTRQPPPQKLPVMIMITTTKTTITIRAITSTLLMQGEAFSGASTAVLKPNKIERSGLIVSYLICNHPNIHLLIFFSAFYFLTSFSSVSLPCIIPSLIEMILLSIFNEHHTVFI